jgi:hypothetical protein
MLLLYMRKPRKRERPQKRLPLIERPRQRDKLISRKKWKKKLERKLRQQKELLKPPLPKLKQQQKERKQNKLESML